MPEPVPAIPSLSQPLTLKQHVLGAVKEAIITPRLKPGRLYSESNLAEKLNVSRTPVREALISLSSMGFVTIARRRGFQINTWTKTFISEIYLFRKMLEMTIVRLVTPEVTKEVIKKLEAIHDREVTAISSGDIRSHQRADRAIHLFLAAQAQNSYLYSSLECIRDLIEWIGYEDRRMRPYLLDRFSQQHLELIEALKLQNAAAVVAVMDRHIDLGEAESLKTIELLEAGN